MRRLLWSLTSLALVAAALTAVLARSGRAAAGTTGGPYGVYVTTDASIDELPANGLGGSPSTFDTLGSAYQFGALAINATATLGIVRAEGDGANLSRADIFRVPGNTVIGSIQRFDPVAFAMDPANPNIAFAVDGSNNVYSLTLGSGTVGVPPALADINQSPSHAAGTNSQCSSVAVDPSGTTLVLGCYAYDTATGGVTSRFLVDVSVTNGSVGSAWPVPLVDTALDLAVTPDGAGVVGIARGGRIPIVFRLPLHFNSSTAVTWTQALTKPVPVPTAVTVSPDGATVFVGGNNGVSSSSGVEAFSAASGSPGLANTVNLFTDANGGGGLSGLTLAPDGRTLYAYGATTLATGATQNLIYPLAPGTLAVGAASSPLPSGRPLGPHDIAVTPDQAPAANLAPASGTAGVPLTLNATASNVRYGSITRYAWVFGDGTSQVTGGPTVTHTYASAGNYTATVTETDSAGTSVPPAPSAGGAAVNGPGTTPYLAAAFSAAISAPVAIGRPGAPPPPPPTTVPFQPGTTTTTTSKPPVSVPPGFHPVLTLNPAVGTPGTIVMVSGHGFPPNKSVTVAWSTKTGSFVETTDAHGDLPPHELDLLTPDVLGPRYALAGITGSPLPAAIAAFLVVPNTAEPGGGDRLLFRSEGP